VGRRRLGFWRRLAVSALKPLMLALTRRNWSGIDNIPRSGGAIIVPNHLSHADPGVAAHFIYDSGRWPHFLAKASLFHVPVLGPWLRAIRQIPVYRGTVDAVKALEAAIAAVNAGQVVIIYPEGTITEDPNLWPMHGKTGAARLWLATGAPVIPLVMWGPQCVYDSHRTRMRMRMRLRVPVTVKAGPPIDLSRWSGAVPTTGVLDEITDEMMLRLRDMLAPLRGEAPPPLFTPPWRTAEDVSTVDGAMAPAKTTADAGADNEAGAVTGESEL
jgi:1-acyl-sn-glycerol-3-phosphate acyltransferase